MEGVESEDLYYLRVGNAKDFARRWERILYRAFEVMPGFMIWATFGAALFFSWFEPLWVAFFIIAFDLYWILKVVYFSIHTRVAYNRMKQYLKRDWLSELEKLPPPRQLSADMPPYQGREGKRNYPLPFTRYQDLWHLVILPIYKESYEVLHPAVRAIAESHWPKERMILVLTVEEAAGKDAKEYANRLQEEFKKVLPLFFVTVHPSNLPGEIQGKGSNERWGGVWAKENVIDQKNIPYEHIIVSSFDADTVVYPHYFSCLAYHYLTCEKPLRSSFQPIPLFTNNIWQAPALSRVIAFSSTFWHTLNQERPEKHVTFSSHSMPLVALVDVGFWQPNVVSEDSRIFWQCFLHYNGDYRVVSLYYPVGMDANVARGFGRTLKNIYKQQRRWAYGSENNAYFLFGFVKKWKKIPKGLMWRYGFNTIEGFHSWATHALLIFLLGWLPLVLGGEAFNASILSYSLPRVTRILLTVAMLGIMSSVFLSILILPPRPPDYGRWKYVLMVLQWFLVPVTLVIFGSLPAIEAQTRLMLGRYLGFWPTEKFRK